MENAMSDDEKKEYGKMDDEAKCSYRKNMKERKNAADKKALEETEKETRENSIKVKAAEDARAAAKANIKTFTVINSQGKVLETPVVGTKDDGSLTSGLKRGSDYFGKKFAAKK